jgi:hypothetical protein
MNNLLTDVSSWIEAIASARSSATLKHVIRSFVSSQWRGGTVFVTTTLLMTDSAIRSCAGPERTACEAHA